MPSALPRIVLVFVDGIGLAPASRTNPLSSTPSPAVRELLGGGLTSESVARRPGLALEPIDANLGVAGLPQSATGQTALFTGINAAQVLGRHVTAFPGPRLRRLLNESSIFLQLAREGLATTFANPFPPGYRRAVLAGKRRASATTWAALAADLRLRSLGDLAAGRAVSWDIEGDRMAARGPDRQARRFEEGRVDAIRAGENLARIARRFRFTLFETFATDLAGHHRWGWTADEAWRRVDGLLDGLLAAKSRATTVLLTSDHGNLEDATNGSHTRNPVPLLAVGPLAGELATIRSITDLTPAVVSLLASGRKCR